MDALLRAATLVAGQYEDWFVVKMWASVAPSLVLIGIDLELTDGQIENSLVLGS